MNHPISIILLVAGDSKRFQGNKLLHPVKGRPLFTYAMDLIEVLEVEEKIVVTQYEPIAIYARNRGIKVVYNEGNVEIGSSIKKGVEAANPIHDLLFLTGDTPYLKLATLEKLIESHKEKGTFITCSKNKSQYIQPSLFSHKLRRELLSLEGKIGGKQIIQRHPGAIQSVEISDEECFDIDRREDIK